MQNALKILFVNYDANIGGGQTNLLTILKQIDRNKFIPEIVCCKKGLFTAELEKAGFIPHIIDFGKGRIRYLNKSLPAILRMYSFIKNKKIALIHANSFNAFKISAVAAKLAGVRIIWYEAP